MDGYSKTWSDRCLDISPAHAWNTYALPKTKTKKLMPSTYAMIKLKGDAVVNHAIESRLERESKWSKKYSTIT